MSRGETPARAIRGRQPSPRRVATRKRIVDAATKLFLRDGYQLTTVAAIADEAGTSVQSLYLVFGSKLSILSAALDIAIVGDDVPTPLMDRAWVRKVAAEANGPAAVAKYAAGIRWLLVRTYPLFAVLQAASGGEAGELLRENKRQRYEGVRTIATYMSQKKRFNSSLTIDLAADVLYAFASEDHYGLLVVERGWSPGTWQKWWAATLTEILFP